jgi:hypothetical protein
MLGFLLAFHWVVFGPYFNHGGVFLGEHHMDEIGEQFHMDYTTRMGDIKCILGDFINVLCSPPFYLFQFGNKTIDQESEILSSGMLYMGEMHLNSKGNLSMTLWKN